MVLCHAFRQQGQPPPKPLRLQHLHPQAEGEQVAVQPRILRKGDGYLQRPVRPTGDAALVELVIHPVGEGGGEAQAHHNRWRVSRPAVFHGRRGENLVEGLSVLQLQHPGELEGAVVAPLQAEGLEVPGLSLEHQPGGAHLPPGGGPAGGEVEEGELPAGENGVLHHAEPGVVLPGAAPAGELHPQPVRLRPLKQGGQLGQGVRRLPSGLHRQAPEGGEQLPLLRLGKGGTVEGIALQQGHAAVPPRRGVHRNPRRRQGVHVPIDGAHRHLEVLRQLPGGHAAPLQQEAEQLKQPALGHQGVLSRAIL